MTLERFSEWVQKNYPPDRYDNVFDLIRDVEQRVNSDGNEMNDKVKQLLLDQFAPIFDPRYRQLLQRREDEQQAADMLGSGKIPRSLADEIIEDLRQPEIMGVDISEYSTTREDIIPPEVKRFTSRIPFTTRISGFFKRIFGR